MAGVILPDLPMEELGEWEPFALDAGLATVQLASPLTPDERLARLCARSQGFVYGVNLLGVTGERGELADSSAVLAKRLKATTDLPVIMGFGIATPEQAVAAAEHADGVVVASALMRQRLDGASPEDLGASVAAFRAALDRDLTTASVVAPVAPECGAGRPQNGRGGQSVGRCWPKNVRVRSHASAAAASSCSGRSGSANQCRVPG